jgi:hypothetical protein
VWLGDAIEAASLECPYRLIGAQQIEKVRADERLREPSMNEIERSRAAALPERL